ncbi:MAG: hypothetical protein P1V97_33885 [Planctomycetota bacterium]|nr:hypothetical protein [Planctomycetota bacterium]
MNRFWLFLSLSLFLLGVNTTVAGPRTKVPDKAALKAAQDKYIAVFEIRDDNFVGKHVTDKEAGKLAHGCWARIKALFPLSYRKLLVQFNIMSGRKLAGAFDGSGKNDVGRKGYRLSVAKYCAAKEKRLGKPQRQVTRRRGTLDWTLVHEMGHSICLRMNVIELFSQSFDGDNVPQPKRRKRPTDYAKDGSPSLSGNFVTSYAERKGGDEEVVETFTTYMLLKKLRHNSRLPGAAKAHPIAES